MLGMGVFRVVMMVMPVPVIMIVVVVMMVVHHVQAAFARAEGIAELTIGDI